MEMSSIEISCLEPRSEEQREKLAKATTIAVWDIFKISKEAVWIMFSEMPHSHFFKGGILWKKVKVMGASLKARMPMRI